MRTREETKPLHVARPATAAGPKPRVSVVVPVFNEELNVSELYDRLAAVLSGDDVEFIFVDDGSTDRTGSVLESLAARDDRLRLIRFRRNFGQTAALSAGIDHARGAIIIPMDGDLQNDPQDIPRLLARLDEGYDVVSGWRVRRRDPLHRRIPSQIANWLISMISGVRLHDYGCSLKAYRRDVLADVRLYGEMHRFVPIYASWQGARVTELPVDHHPRTRGKSNYGIERTIKVVLDMIVVKFLSSYATKPIYVFGGFGLMAFALSGLAFGLMLYYKYLAASPKTFIETPLPMVVVMFGLVGCLSVLLGLVAELTVRTYYESQGKRTYAIRPVEDTTATKSGAD
ncbi:MAG: glycosyltransferase family 2 protein [Gemmatimonadetes bacterium]|nr:glycosyltransferase family 2 protein [Gemmatimonadota bacterium]